MQPTPPPRPSPGPPLLLPAALLAALLLAGLAPPAPRPAPAAEPLPEIALGPDDTVITRSVRIRPETWRRDDAGDLGLVQVKGNDLTIDFSGGLLDGAAPGLPPDEYRGWGLVAVGCKNLTLRNLRVRGVKVALYFKDCDGLTLSGCELSDLWRQRLQSTPEAEDARDWLFGHANDANEWFRYGAAVYVERSRHVTLSGNRGRHGQNGICLARVEEARLFDNDFSFRSGWGLALWRSSRNVVAHNRFDWCIRGYSHGVYARGQDSAGILAFEQCRDNVFAYNSATHGGDGFFLYAGHETVQRTGEGGSNGNLLYRNDFSCAAANGIEATFSTGNRFVENTLEECEHAVWAGYSSNTLILRNTIRRCANGISIEHGQDNRIEANEFSETPTGIRLWWQRNVEFAGTAFGHARDTWSHGYVVAHNRFAAVDTAVRLTATSEVDLVGNRFEQVRLALALDAASKEVRADALTGAAVEGGTPAPFAESGRRAAPPPLPEFAPPEVPGTLDPAVAAAQLPRGRRFIFVDEWGPYDFAVPRLAPERIAGWGPVAVRVLGPAGGGFVLGPVGGDVAVEPLAGEVPGVLRLTPRGSGLCPIQAEVWIGPAAGGAGEGGTLPLGGWLVGANWRVRYFAWPAAGAQRGPTDWPAVTAGAPLAEVTAARLDFHWGGAAPGPGLPADQFALVAEAETELPAGEYLIRCTSDDGVRVWVDGRAVLDNWTWHGPTEDRAELAFPAAGRHRFRVEYFEIDGHAELAVRLEPARR